MPIFAFAADHVIVWIYIGATLAAFALLRSKHKGYLINRGGAAFGPAGMPGNRHSAEGPRGRSLCLNHAERGSG